MKKLPVIGSVLGTLTALSAGCVAYGVAIEQHCFQLRHVRVPVLPPGHRPIRILHLSDLHLSPGQVRKISWIRTLGELPLDLVVNTGDNIASPQALRALADSFEPLSGAAGVFVLGSNDFYAPRPINPLKYFIFGHSTRHVPRLPTQDLTSVMTDLGWIDVQRQQAVFTLKDTTIEIRGCGDAHSNSDDYAAVMGELSDGADLLIAVTHAPYRRVLDEMVADGAGLILAGHTHGGQVCLPGGLALTTNCDLPLRQAKGLSRHRHGSGSAYLHVSAGLGTSPYAPYRFCCPPEATLLTLVERQPTPGHV